MDSKTEQQRWVICPVCNEVNPADVKFCQHCWGAALNQEEAFSSEELEGAQKSRESYRKRRKIIRFGIIGGLFAVVLTLLLVIIFNYTDLIFKPDVTVNSNPPSGEWSMFHSNLTHTGSYNSDTVIPEGNLKWVFFTGEAVHSSPAVVDGLVYFGSRDKNLYVVDAKTGEEAWRYKTGSYVDSSPSVTGGKVYFGSNDSNLYALDSKTGEKIWAFDTPYPVRSSPAIADGKVFFGSDDYFLYAVDEVEGTEIWKFDTGSPVSSSPVVDNGIVYIGAAGKYSYALNAKTGRLRLMYNTHYSVFTTPLANEGTVYFTTFNGVVNAVDGMARTWLWEHDIRPYWAQAWAMINWLPKPPEQSGLLWTKTLYRPNTTTPVYEDGVLYLGSGSVLIALDVDTQEILWQFPTGGEINSCPAKAGPVIYFGNDSGHLYAVDAETGELRWDYEIGSAITSSPAVVDGVVYVGAHDGNMYAIE